MVITIHIIIFGYPWSAQNCISLLVLFLHIFQKQMSPFTNTRIHLSCRYPIQAGLLTSFSGIYRNVIMEPEFRGKEQSTDYSRGISCSTGKPEDVDAPNFECRLPRCTMLVLDETQLGQVLGWTCISHSVNLSLSLSRMNPVVSGRIKWPVIHIVNDILEWKSKAASSNISSPLCKSVHSYEKPSL